ncbi:MULTISPECIES: MupA/Atu3671 family FMN-dependent luciferase-like monooxygenase [Rhodococcus]|uniref:MupA/Atu3671 family FMN-dependent luciferase-like monooxygenase n=1 Tax=Rhodococcus TaxID=1827 RepID=UPI000ADE9F54|nr:MULTISPECIES: MupA/Atu3671 family FMN-dependent luciferase-like monooxygenase [Rhodococcus]
MNARPSLSVMFFSGSVPADRTDRYRLVHDAAAVADRLGYEAIWLPERHFDVFGGLFPNPSVLAAALAGTTKRCHLRAGSVVAPLHDPIRIAEEWSVVDNLSGGGRIGLSIGSGWNTNDFVLAPDRYETRVAHSRDSIDELRALWAGRRVARRNGSGRTVEVAIQPEPLSGELPLWMTASGNPDTFTAAGRLGTNLLTHLLGQDLGELACKIKLYRDARATAGHDPDSGRVTLMLHTLATADNAHAWTAARAPLRSYLRSALELELRASAGGRRVSGGRRIAVPALSEAVVEELLDERTRRFFDDASLLGAVPKCLAMLEAVAAAGVDEVACLIDFGPSRQLVLDSLNRLAPLLHPEVEGAVNVGTP